ncbi:hydroxyphenylacetyl-CoA thioesterase PaaI [Nocardia miyunensis]|uniref:hydroxyphenylacetyl-CoA thioesterase PaaI n=1 Tax=Nocardia miyunensis TaxID=282684 RepID=UPI0008314E2E|nr:hydroxyphenylacetyl-CoA thioesterase PaaI [Nocardia miyunensis]
MVPLDSAESGLAAAMFEADTASHELGIQIIELGVGHATATMTVTETMVNGHGTTHGGYVFLLADTTFALACNSHGRPAVAARADIRYLRPTRAGDILTAHATERTRFGRNGIYDVTVSTTQGTPIAEFRGDSRITTHR